MPVTARFWGEALGRAVDPNHRRAARDQDERVEIPLHRHAPLDLVARKREIDAPIEPDGIDRNIFDVAQEPGADPARKPDHLRTRHLTTHLCDNALRRLDTPPHEFL